ncbi:MULTISPECIES: hypothetical protein [unclassified Pseudomonas]|uniref:hypothetical protein n=1 Tax=unclassified Pseudomonas TaxID=196821 RepID=UPI001481D3AA|nr:MULTISPECIES: hypothetical protein [unclassified Pseudomonas]
MAGLLLSVATKSFSPDIKKPPEGGFCHCMVGDKSMLIAESMDILNFLVIPAFMFVSLSFRPLPQDDADKMCSPGAMRNFAVSPEAISAARRPSMLTVVLQPLPTKPVSLVTTSIESPRTGV